MNNKIEYSNISIANLDRISHSTLAFNTRTTDGKRNYELIKGSSLPVPVFAVKYSKHFEDPVKKFTTEKIQFARKQKQIESRLLSRFKLKKISKNDDLIEDNMKAYIRNRILNPHTYFKPDCFELNLNKGTLASVGNELTDFTLAHVYNNRNVQFTNASSSFSIAYSSFDANVCETPNEILINENSGYIGVRHKSYVRIGKAPNYQKLEKEEDDLTVKTKVFDKYNIKSDIIASSLNHSNLTLINTDHVLRRYDLDVGAEIYYTRLAKHIEIDPYPISLQDHITREFRNKFVTLTTRNNFIRLDCRNKRYEASEKIFSSDDKIMKCEKLLNHCESLLNENLVYIASSHVLYTFDYRQLKQPVVYWHHQLLKPALLLKNSLYNTHEVICISSHTPGDLKLFNINGSELNYYPMKPFSIKNSYNSLREQGLFLLSEDIKERVDSSITGIALQCDHYHSKINLFTHNCYGDIYKTILKCKADGDVEENEEIIENFQLWEDALQIHSSNDPDREMTTNERLEIEELVFSNITRLTRLSKILKGDVNYVNNITEFEVENNIADPKPKWKVNIEEARACDDLLAKEIMFQWDDIEIEEAPPQLFEVALEQTKLENENGIDRISEWINRIPDDNDDAEMKTEEIVDDSIILFTPTQTSTTSTAVKKKKPGRVAGF